MNSLAGTKAGTGAETGAGTGAVTGAGTGAGTKAGTMAMLPIARVDNTGWCCSLDLLCWLPKLLYCYEEVVTTTFY